MVSKYILSAFKCHIHNAGIAETFDFIECLTTFYAIVVLLTLVNLKKGKVGKRVCLRKPYKSLACDNKTQ